MRLAVACGVFLLLPAVGWAACSHKGQSCGETKACCLVGEDNEANCLVCQGGGCKLCPTEPTTTSTTRPCVGADEPCPGDTRCCAGYTCIIFQDGAHCALVIDTPTTTTRSTTTTLPPLTFPLQPPVRPNGMDLTIKFKPETMEFFWYPLSNAEKLHPADQRERDEMEWEMMERAYKAIDHITEADPKRPGYRKGIPGCEQATSFCLSQMTAIVGRIGVDYEDRALCGDTCSLASKKGGIWDVPNDGRHYSISLNCAQAASACLMRAGRLAVTRLQSDPDALNFYYLRVDGDRLVPATWKLPGDEGMPPLPFPNAQRAAYGPVNSKIPAPKPTGEQVELLHKTHQSHRAGSFRRCGWQPLEEDVAAGSNRQAHMDFEASAYDEIQGHFFQMKAFSGRTDPQWSFEEGCSWALLEDVFHDRWMQAVAEGDWAKTREADSDHKNAHFCANLKDPRVEVLFSCGTGRRVLSCKWSKLHEGRQPCQVMLPYLLAMYHDELEALRGMAGEE